VPGIRQYSRTVTPTDQPEEVAILAAVRAGDQAAFAALAERYRRQLHVHCYRMLGSVEDAEDVVQETLLRAWRSRASFQGRSLFRTWGCTGSRPTPASTPSSAPRAASWSPTSPRATRARNYPPTSARTWPRRPLSCPWLQPYPDHLLDQAAPSDAEPDAVVVARETIELAYLAAIQYLPPRQRAILILRDALGWSAKDTAGLLETSVASVNSALQRARSTMRARLPARRLDWTQATGPSDEERSVLRRFMDAHDRADVAAFAALLREDARQAMPPHLLWYDGRKAMVTVFARYIHPASPNYPGQLRFVAAAANRQPAVAVYLRREGDDRYLLLGLNVLEVEKGQVSAITSFGVQLLGAFGLPQTLPADR
jgi:RNA polymerase sigma-70 factor (ECF subfamily)